MNARQHPLIVFIAFIGLLDKEAFRIADGLFERGVFHRAEVNLAIRAGQARVLPGGDFAGFIGAVVAAHQSDIAGGGKLGNLVGYVMAGLLNLGFLAPPFAFFLGFLVVAGLLHRLSVEIATLGGDIHIAGAHGFSLVVGVDLGLLFGFVNAFALGFLAQGDETLLRLIPFARCLHCLRASLVNSVVGRVQCNLGLLHCVLCVHQSCRYLRLNIVLFVGISATWELGWVIPSPLGFSSFGYSRVVSILQYGKLALSLAFATVRIVDTLLRCIHRLLRRRNPTSPIRHRHR